MVCFHSFHFNGVTYNKLEATVIVYEVKMNKWTSEFNREIVKVKNLRDAIATWKRDGHDMTSPSAGEMFKDMQYLLLCLNSEMIYKEKGIVGIMQQYELFKIKVTTDIRRFHEPESYIRGKLTFVEEKGNSIRSRLDEMMSTFDELRLAVKKFLEDENLQSFAPKLVNDPLPNMLEQQHLGDVGANGNYVGPHGALAGRGY